MRSVRFSRSVLFSSKPEARARAPLSRAVAVGIACALAVPAAGCSAAPEAEVVASESSELTVTPAVIVGAFEAGKKVYEGIKTIVDFFNGNEPDPNQEQIRRLGETMARTEAAVAQTHAAVLELTDVVRRDAVASLHREVAVQLGETKGASSALQTYWRARLAGGPEDVAAETSLQALTRAPAEALKNVHFHLDPDGAFDPTLGLTAFATAATTRLAALRLLRWTPFLGMEAEERAEVEGYAAALDDYTTAAERWVEARCGSSIETRCEGPYEWEDGPGGRPIRVNTCGDISLRASLTCVGSTSSLDGGVVAATSEAEAEARLAASAAATLQGMIAAEKDRLGLPALRALAQGFRRATQRNLSGVIIRPIDPPWGGIIVRR